MPYKKRNTELEQGMHNPPDQYFLKYGQIKLYSDSLFLTPRVQTTYVRSIETHKTVLEWTSANQISYERSLELEDIINNFVDYFSLSSNLRKELFRAYRETQLVKLNQAIDGLKKSGELLWNEKVKLPEIYFKIKSTLNIYIVVRDNLEKRKTGKHQLLYDMLMPLLYKLREYKYAEYKIKDLITDLVSKFDLKSQDVGRELLKYEKKEYFSDNIIKQIKSIINK